MIAVSDEMDGHQGGGKGPRNSTHQAQLGMAGLGGWLTALLMPLVT
jgi:hypothetical protein